MNPSIAWTMPENRGVCGFCGNEENGYAKKNESGNWQAACWKCVKPASASMAQPKRNFVGTVYTDIDAEAESPVVPKKRPGMAPSTHRPKVS